MTCTVGQLITKLQQFDADTLITLRDPDTDWALKIGVIEDVATLKNDKEIKVISMSGVYEDIEPFNFDNLVSIRLLEDERNDLEHKRKVTVPVEVLNFYKFADAVFVPFTPQCEELMKSLNKARAAVNGWGKDDGK